MFDPEESERWPKAVVLQSAGSTADCQLAGAYISAASKKAEASTDFAAWGCFESIYFSSLPIGLICWFDYCDAGLVNPAASSVGLLHLLQGLNFQLWRHHH
jgi:hypothetical protein